MKNISFCLGGLTLIGVFLTFSIINQENNKIEMKKQMEVDKIEMKRHKEDNKKELKKQIADNKIEMRLVTLFSLAISCIGIVVPYLTTKA